MRIAGGRSVGRGQAIQLGALLLFAILIINLSLFQVFVVPDQNGEIEFKHSQQVQEELETARSLAQQAVATDAELSTSIQLGPQYPSRTLFVNPAPPAGTIETVDRGDIVVTNAEPTANETAQAWDETGETFATKGLAYRPGYNYYDNAPTTVYDASVLYNIQPDGTVRSRTGQTLVSGNRITLVAMSGSMGTSASSTETIEFQPASGPSQRVPVEPTGSGDFTIALETQIPENVWRNQLLAEEIDGSDSDPNAYIESIDCSASDPDNPCGTLTLTFENSGDETYSLRLGEVGVGDNVDDEPESYITRVDPTTASLSVTEGNQREITVEVRDRYDNPVSGVDVTATATNSPDDIGSFAAGSTPTRSTNSDGQVSFVFDAGTVDATGTEDLEFSIGDVDGSGSVEDYELVEQSLTAEPSGGGSGGDGTAPAVSNAQADPNTIVQSQEFDLSATFDDTSGRGGSDIFEATWSDTISGDSGDFSTADGEFDQAVEDVETTVSGSTTDDWSTGDHDIEITGTDANGNSQTTTVTVTVTSGPAPGFSSVSASDMDTQQTNDAEQTLTFTPDQDLPAGETVRIDLSDAQDSTGPNTNQYQVDYQGSTISVDSGGGSAQFTTRDDENAVVEYTPGGTVTTGTQVEINIDGATTGNNGQQSNPYDVVFSRSDGGQETTIFNVSN